jgi:hypothetical protein
MVLSTPQSPNNRVPPKVESASPKINLGAAGDSGATVNAKYGALNPGTLQQYLQMGKSLYPEAPEKDPWLTAFQFFTNMAAEASKPGATAIGAAGTAGATTVNTLLEERKQKRAEALGAAQMGVTLASAFKPATGITVKKGENVTFMSEKDAQKKYPTNVYGTSFWKNFVPYDADGTTVNTSLFGDIFINPAGQTMVVSRLYGGGILRGPDTTIVPGAKPAAIDVGESQDSLIYRTKANATKYLIDKGLPADSPGFASLVNRMVPKKGYDALLGSPVVSGDSYQGISFVVKGTKIIGANIGPMKGAEEPRALAWAKKSLAELAKNDNYIDQTFNVLPQVNRGLEILLSERTITGKWQEFTLPFRAALVDAFKLDKRDITNQQLLKSISNVLAPKMRPEGSGSTSDMEFDAFREAILALGNTTLANYLSMYTFKRVAENSRNASVVKATAIADGGGPTEVKKILEDMDTGIYSRFSDDPELTTAENDARFTEFLNTRKRGEVIYNYDKTTGGKLIDVDSQGSTMPDFIVSNGKGSYILFR